MTRRPVTGAATGAAAAGTASTALPPAGSGAAAGGGPVVRPYGDTTGDGMVQLSFTLPIPLDERAAGAAAQLAAKMGLDPALVVHTKAIGPTHTFFVVYGRVGHLVDLAAVQVTPRDYPLLSAREVNLAVRSGWGRKLVVLGACIGTDAHTVGIDAILNVKGFAGEKGLEYYRELRVVNLGAQVDIAELVARARRERADAVLVSQVVTQKDAHLANTRALAAALRAGFPAGARPLLVVGGPRFDPTTAGDLGVDRVFGKGTTPGDVASYLVHALVHQRAAATTGRGGRARTTTTTARTTTARTTAGRVPARRVAAAAATAGGTSAAGRRRAQPAATP